MHGAARRITIVVFVLLTTMAACGVADRAAPVATPSPTAGQHAAAPPAGLTASLVQYRRDQPRRYVEVQLANASGGPLDVTLLDVTLPGFGHSGDVRRTTHLEDGRRVDLPVPLADPRCDQPPTDVASALILVRAHEGPAARTSVPLDDGGLLTRLHRFDCAVALARSTVDITLSPGWERRGDGSDVTMRGEATARLRDDATVVISEVNGGILFVVPPDGVQPSPPATLDRAQPAMTITFDVVPARCDGHAVAEARRLTTITFVVVVDGAEPVPLRIAPDEAGFDQLITALRERCAAA